MTDIPPALTPGTIVDPGTFLGYISNQGTADRHLHFVVYTGANGPDGLTSFNATLTPRLKQSSLTQPVSAGTNILQVGDTSAYSIADVVRINPGAPNEEQRSVVGFGSIIVDSPLQFDHAASEPVVLVKSLVDSDADGVANTTDNCPAAPNPSQTNTDNEIDNGPGIPTADGTVPNAIADTVGDACSPGPDTDHDGLPDLQDTEPLGATGVCATFAGASDGHPNPAFGDITDADGNGPSWDTDNDGVLDGVECQLGTNPRSAATKPSTTACGGAADADADGLTAADEYCKWGTSDTNLDSDGDGKKDCTEANDTDGNGFQNFTGDTINSAKAALGLIGKTMDFDLDGNGLVSFTGDTILSAKMALHVVDAGHPLGYCPLPP